MLDPTWDPASGLGTARRSRDFPNVLKRLLRSIPDANQYDGEPADELEERAREVAYQPCVIELQEVNTAVLLRVVRVTAGEIVEAYVADFLDGYAPTTPQTAM